MSMQAIKKINLFEELSTQDLKNIEGCLNEKFYQKGDTLFSDGEHCKRIFFVQSGRIKIFRIAHSGREQILEILNAGETCACHPGIKDWCCTTSAQAVEPSHIWYLSVIHYIRFLQIKPQLSYTLNKVFARRFCRFSSLIEELALNDVKKRLIKFVLDIIHQGEQGEDYDNIPLPFTHEEIAHRLGTSRETITRYFQQLKHTNLLEIQSRKIVGHDKEGLENMLI